jgi:hypothetical protein
VIISAPIGYRVSPPGGPQHSTDNSGIFSISLRAVSDEIECNASKAIRIISVMVGCDRHARLRPCRS